MSVGKLVAGHAPFALGFTAGKNSRTPSAMRLRRNHALTGGNQLSVGSALGGCSWKGSAGQMYASDVALTAGCAGMSCADGYALAATDEA